jgi:molecular chaperone DnaK (HSP70)
MRTQTLAIDFGTSNSAAAVLEDGKVRRLSI